MNFKKLMIIGCLFAVLIGAKVVEAYTLNNFIDPTNLTKVIQPVVINPGKVPQIPYQPVPYYPYQIQPAEVRPIKLRSRTIIPGQTNESESLEALHDLMATSSTMEGPVHLLIQLDSLPTKADRANLKQRG